MMGTSAQQHGVKLFLSFVSVLLMDIKLASMKGLHHKASSQRVASSESGFCSGPPSKCFRHSHPLSPIPVMVREVPNANIDPLMIRRALLLNRDLSTRHDQLPGNSTSGTKDIGIVYGSSRALLSAKVNPIRRFRNL